MRILTPGNPSPVWESLTVPASFPVVPAVAEPDPGFSSPLALRVATLATWGEWRDRHPETRVLAPHPDLKKLYKRDPYHSYFGSDLLHFPVRPLPPPEGLLLKDRLVIVTVDGHHEVFALRDLAVLVGAEHGEVEVEAAGLPLRITFRVAPGTAFVEPLATPQRLEAVRHSFWFAWYAFGGMIPDTKELLVSDPSG